MQIRIILRDQVIPATLADNASARDFASMLPLTLTLEDYAATEKISMLARKLSTADAPDGITPVTGEIAYYAPWGNLAIFHRPFRYSSGLVRLGHIASGIEALAAKGNMTVRIEVSPR